MKEINHFANRQKRIALREERDRFSIHMQPVVWILGLFGLTGMTTLALHYKVTGESVVIYWCIAGAPLVVVSLYLVIRALRGHFDDELNNF